MSYATHVRDTSTGLLAFVLLKDAFMKPSVDCLSAMYSCQEQHLNLSISLVDFRLQRPAMFHFVVLSESSSLHQHLLLLTFPRR